MNRPDLKREHLWGLVLLITAGSIYLWGVQRGWTMQPTDAHSSRQAQTAITAQMLHEDGFTPLTPFNGLGPPWHVPMEFPTYQLMVATVANLTGGNIIVAGRLVGILGTLLLLPALWRILKSAEVDFTSRAIAIAFLLTSPLWIVFSRAVLIESWAAALAVWWLAGLMASLAGERPDRRWLIATGLLGIIAALTKVTTFAVWLPVGAAITLLAAHRQGRQKLFIAAGVTLPGVAAALIWNHYADAVKSAHPYANFLTSDNLSAWNWGTWAQRTDPAWWSRIFTHLGLIFPWWAWVVVAGGVIWGRRRERIAIGLGLLAIATGALAFANLYYVHNYYFMAVAPAAVAALAVAWSQPWRMTIGRPRWRTGLSIAVLVALGFQVQLYRDGLGRGQVRDRPLPALGELIRDLTRAEDHIIIIGREWDPLLTYTIDRPLTFVRENYETDEDAWQMSRAAMAPADYTVLIATDSVAGDTRFVHHRCRELGLLTDPIVSTREADIYVSAEARDALAPQVAAWRAAGRILPNRPDRMGPGESRVEFITADWRPLNFVEDAPRFALFQPLPDQVFTRYPPAPMPAFDREVLHIHPPGGLRFNAISRDRTVNLEFGLNPEIWLNQNDTDGVRFRLFQRGPDGRQRLVWSEFVQPLTRPEHRRLLHMTQSLPADHDLELWIDAGPDHNPGYDWSIIASMRIE